MRAAYVARAVLASLLGFAAAGGVAGWLWAQTTSTPRHRALPGGAVQLDVTGFAAAFNADAGYLLIGLLVAVVAGGAVAWAFRSGGVFTVLAVLLGSVLGAWTAYTVGVELGPDPLDAQAAGANPGDLLAGPLEIRASGVFFAWPIGALVGVFAALLVSGPDANRDPAGSR